MAQGINMTTDVRTDASLNKTSTNTNDSSADSIADDTSIDNSSADTMTDDVGVDNSTSDSVSDDTQVDDEIVNEEMIITEISVEAIDIGNTLQEKRLELGYDERQVATELKISIDQVRALESNKFTHFRSVTFTRGFLKSYCRLLGIEHSKVLDAFDSGQKEAESTIKPVDKVHRQTHLGDPIVIFISVVIVAVLVFLVFWWPTDSATNTVFNDRESQAVEEVKAPVLDTLISDESNENELDSESIGLDSTPTDAESVTVEKEVPKQETIKAEISKVEAPKQETPKINIVKNTKPVAKAASVNSDVVTGLSAETVAILKEAGVSPDEVVRATKVVPATETPSAASQTVAYLDDIEMAFSEDCWAEIRDASGTILFSGVQSAGSTLALTGNAPYRVVLGYAKGVSSLKYKGELFDFSPFTRKDLARFELK